ncbi:MAG: T9SS type A sorting domain-containing protein [Bacteroidales bacterium]|nr:T9SS type A sorting domain-containing protein [Bacteroidales bacterium]
MKRSLPILFLAFILSLSVTAQQTLQLKNNLKEYKAIDHVKAGIDPVKSASLPGSTQQAIPFVPNSERNTNVVSVLDIGTSANAYGYYAGNRSMVWADPTLNIVTNFHRMGGAGDPGGYSGDLGVDISYDGGLSWTNNVEVYEAINNTGGDYYADAARYPNHGIFNPSGNTDNNNAWIAFFAPNLDQSNGGTWGGYSHGVANAADPTMNTYNLITSNDGLLRLIPSGYDMTNTGMSIAVDVNYNAATSTYNQSIILTKGFWDDGLQDFSYSVSTLDHFTVAGLTTGPADIKIAFAADGLTGYLVALSDDGSAEQVSGFPGFYPIIFKTTDGGETWSDPTFIQLGGVNGLPGVVNDLLTDEQIAEVYEEPLPERVEIPYTTSFECDLAVDANGNLHIAAVLGVTGSTAYSIASGTNLMAAYDLYTADGGLTWNAIKLGQIRQLRGTWGTISEDNRIQTSMTWDRSTVFVSWNDTDLEEQEDNSRPNVFSRGLKPNAWGTADMTCYNGNNAPTNVTLFSVAMWNASFTCVAPYVLENDGKYTIPMAYQALTDNNDVAPVQFKYIKDFFFTDNDFCIIGTPELANSKKLEVSQNFPNPFSNQSFIQVTLSKGEQLSMEIYNITGQKVANNNLGYRNAGVHTLTLDGSTLPSGIYFYTLQAGNEKITRKMIVR